MALGKRRTEQQELWVATSDLPRSDGHPFYRRLNRTVGRGRLSTPGSNNCAEPHYHDQLGRPGIPPGIYFRMILVGYFEGTRRATRASPGGAATAVRCRSFSASARLDETPDHSSLTRIAKRLPPANSRGGVSAGLGDGRRQRLGEGQNDGRRFDHARGQRRHEEHRAARHGRQLSRVFEEAGGGGRSGETRPPKSWCGSTKPAPTRRSATTSGSRKPTGRAALRR